MSEEVATKKPAPKKPVPRAPVAEKKPSGKKGQERRFFLFDLLGSAWTAFGLALTAMTLGTVRFMFPNVLAEPPSQFPAGNEEDFLPGQVYTQFKDQYQVWIVHLAEERRIVALSTVCTHLGCSPSWLESEQKFKCPCHGSGFYRTGINFEGPAPRPLERFAITKLPSGVLVVDKSKKFQYELEQWDDSQSYVST